MTTFVRLPKVRKRLVCFALVSNPPCHIEQRKKTHSKWSIHKPVVRLISRQRRNVIRQTTRYSIGVIISMVWSTFDVIHVLLYLKIRYPKCLCVFTLSLSKLSMISDVFSVGLLTTHNLPFLTDLKAMKNLY